MIRRKGKANVIGFGMRGIYLVALFALIGYLIIPKTRFYFNSPIFEPILTRGYSRTIIMKPGDEYRLYVYTMNRLVGFQSSDFKVATVSILGKITAWRAGTTYIKITDGKKVYKCKVCVVDINKKKLKLSIGESKRLKLKNAFWGVKWSSSDTSIASVSRFGVVHAKKSGTVTISAKYKKKTLKCQVIIH